MLRILALSAALAGPSIDLPELFADQLPKLKERSAVPILLPQRMPDQFDDYFPTGFGKPRRWGLQVGAVENCGGATACFIASFSARERGKPFGPRKVELARGRSGRFKPLTCGASCAPPTIEWRERGATYRIESKFRGRRLIRMANSAIRNGPR
jgi:hypothetical protein